MSYYARHVFVCENIRRDGKCCGGDNPVDNKAVAILRDILKKHNLHGKGKVRINRAGCFNRCQTGPMLAIYPDAIWYRYDNEADLREIANTHLIGGDIVRRLQCDDE